MNLLTLGDSFTKGSELTDAAKDCWPAVLGRMLSAQVDNQSDYGNSNDAMFRKAIAADKYDIVIIAWTESHRMEVFVGEPFVMNRHIYMPGHFSVNHNWTEFKWVKEYYTNHYDEGFFLERWLTQVIALQGYFKSQDQKYLFLNAFGNQQLISKIDLGIKQKVDTRYFLGWPDEGIVEWVHGLPMGKNGHPLEQGHNVIAEKIYEYIGHLGWIS